VDLVKRKRLSTEPEPEKPVEVRTTYLEDVAEVDELAESHYSRPHWARATTETPVRIGDVQDPVVATRATEELHGDCPNVRVRIGDIEID
jgi:hypothetical protein